MLDVLIMFDDGADKIMVDPSTTVWDRLEGGTWSVNDRLPRLTI